MDHGLELALAGDLRIAAASARFGLTDLARGPSSIPWDGGTQRLPRLVGPAWAQDMILTGRIIDAAQALTLGLVNRVVPAGELMAETRRWAHSILAGGPIAIRYVKEAVRKGLELSLPQGLALEADLNIIIQSTQDRAEGIQAFLERRTPKFSGG
jgi:enoyl-CoA hydratase/carnithine racemase